MTTPPITIPSITVPSIVITIFVAALCGALAQLAIGYTRGGCLASLLIGLVGAGLGNWLAASLRLPQIFIFAGGDVIWAFVGAGILVAGLSLCLGGARFG